MKKKKKKKIQEQQSIKYFLSVKHLHADIIVNVKNQEEPNE